jgi:hypothetical protein
MNWRTWVEKKKAMLKTLKMRWMKYFNKKVVVHILIVSQPNNREITQLVGLHKRWQAFKTIIKPYLI